MNITPSNVTVINGVLSCDLAITGISIPLPPMLPSAPPPPPPPPPLPIATGLWSPAWKAVYQRMQAENHVWWQLIQKNADLTATSGERYGDTGLWCTIVYQITGNTAYANKAIVKSLMQPVLGTDNDRREQFGEMVIKYAALLPAMTPAQKTQYLALLNGWANQSKATRLGDGDQTTCCATAMQLLDYVTTGTPEATNWVSQIQPMIQQTQRYLNGYAGGELDQSYEYNLGSVVLVIMALTALPNWGGYTGVPSFLAAHAHYCPFSQTPDHVNALQWWDEQDPRDTNGRSLFARMVNWMMIQGLTGDTTVSRLIQDVVAKYGAVGYGTAEPWARGFLFYNPYLPASTVSTVGTHHSSARGHLYQRTTDTLAMLAATNRSFEDHEWHWTFNVEVYRQGEWVITAPRSYGNWPAYRAEGSNGLSLAGLGAMSTRGPIQKDEGPDWIGMTGVTKGNVYDAGFYNPPATYVRNAERKALTIEINGCRFVVTRDVVDMDNPLQLPNFLRYYTSPSTPFDHQKWLTEAQGLAWTVWHSPTPPTTLPNGISWTTPKGQAVQIDVSSPDGMINSRGNPGSTWGTGVAPSEQRYQTQFHTTGKTLWSVVRIGSLVPYTITGNLVTLGTRTFDFSGTGIA